MTDTLARQAGPDPRLGMPRAWAHAHAGGSGVVRARADWGALSSHACSPGRPRS